MVNRRTVLFSGTAFAAMAAGGAWLSRGERGPSAAWASEGVFEISLTEAQWRERLTDQQFAVLREEATERPYTSPLLGEKRTGTYHCAGCDLALYSSETKYDSGTGWPSFYAALPNAVGTKPDRSLFMLRTEVHCRRCGGHLGHIFDDGPPPTGKRHCINGVALSFEPKSGSAA